MTKPLELKSPDNANSLGLYMLSIVLGGSFATGNSQSPGLTRLLGEYVPVWGLGMMLCGLTCLFAALSCPRSYRPAYWLRIEMWGCLCRGAVWGSYAVAAELMPGAGHLGLILFGLIGAMGVWRSVQIGRELDMLRRASVAPVKTVSVETIADPRNDV